MFYKLLKIAVQQFEASGALALELSAVCQTCAGWLGLEIDSVTMWWVKQIDSLGQIAPPLRLAVKRCAEVPEKEEYFITGWTVVQALC